MLYIYTHGTFVIETLKEVTEKEINDYKNVKLADGTKSQYAGEENNDLIYVGF